jgi:predicted kinase
MIKTLLLVRGVPGAGKTSFIDLLKDNGLGLDVNAYSADDWMVDKRGEYKFDSDKLKQVHDQCQAAVEWDMADGHNLIAVHNTLSTESEIEPYTTLAKKYDYRVISIILERRHSGVNGHGVPRTTIIKMAKRFSVNL